MSITMGESDEHQNAAGGSPRGSGAEGSMNSAAQAREVLEVSLTIQLDHGETKDDIDALFDRICEAACGGCETCGGGVHCDNPEHYCVRLMCGSMSVSSGDEEPAEVGDHEDEYKYGRE